MKTQININPGKINLEAQNVTIKDTNNRITATNVEGALDEIKKKIDEHAAGTNHKHSSEHINYSGKVTGQSSVKGAVDALKSQLDAVVVGGTDVDPRVSQALVDIEAETHQTLKARNDKWEQRIIQIENNTKEAQTTPEIYNVSDIFTVGVGTDSEGNPLDYSESVVKGQVSSVEVKGLTATNIIKNGNFLDGTSGWGAHDDSATLSVSNNTLIATGTGNSANVLCHQGFNANILQTGHKYYVRAILRVTNSECTGIMIQFRSSALLEVASQPSPVQNQWYTLSGIITALGTYTTPYVRIMASYPDAATAAEKVTEVREVIAIDLTVHGLENKTKEELDRMFPYYWNGTKSTVCAGRIRSVGKNLYKEPKSLSDLRHKTTNSVVTFYEDYTEFGQKGTFGIAYSKPIKLKPNTLYTLSVDGVKTSTHGRVQVRDDLGSGLGNGVLLGQCIIPTTRARVSGTFTTPPNGIVYIWYYTNADETVGSMKIYSVQIEEGSRTTPYESYQESTQYVVAKDPVTGEILKLRSLPNGTKDEITVNEGKLIKRISDELVLNGSESWSQVDNTTYSTDILRFDINIPDVKPSHDYSVLSDKFISGAYNDGGTYWNTVENIRVHGSQTIIHVFINKSRLATADVAGFKAWLTANPVTVIYQLATPVEIPIDVEGSLECYPGGTIIVEPYIADKFLYNNGIDLPKPVSQIDIIKGIVDDKWVELSNNYTLSEDGKTLTIDGIENGQYVKVYAPIKPEESTSGIKVMKFPCNLKAQVESNMKQANRANLRIDDLDDFVTTMLLNHEIRLTLLEGGSL